MAFLCVYVVRPQSAIHHIILDQGVEMERAVQTIEIYFWLLMCCVNMPTPCPARPKQTSTRPREDSPYGNKSGRVNDYYLSSPSYDEELKGDWDKTQGVSNPLPWNPRAIRLDHQVTAPSR